MAKPSKAKIETEKKSESPVVKITSSEIQITSSEYINLVGQTLVFEKNVPVSLTQEAFDGLCEVPNFKALVDKGVVKIGL